MSDKKKRTPLTAQPAAQEASFVQGPIEGNPSCHVCGGEMVPAEEGFQCSVCKATTLPEPAEPMMNIDEFAAKAGASQREAYGAKLVALRTEISTIEHLFPELAASGQAGPVAELINRIRQFENHLPEYIRQDYFYPLIGKIEKGQAVGASADPKCPKCGHDAIVLDGTVRKVNCLKCGEQFGTPSIRHFPQFFPVSTPASQPSAERVKELASKIADELAEKGFHRDCGNNNRLVIEHELETIEEVVQIAALSAPKAPAGQLSGRQWLELNFEYDKHGRGYIDRDKGNLHSVQDVLDLYAKQFREAPAPAPLDLAVGKRELRLMAQMRTDIGNLLAELDAYQKTTGEFLEDDDAAIVEDIRKRNLSSGEADNAQD